MHQAYREAPLTGVLLCRSVPQSLKGAPWVGSYSVVQRARRLMGRPLYCSAASAVMWRERSYGDGSTPVCDSAVLPCFHACLAFLHRHIPPWSTPFYPLNLSLHSQQQPLHLDCPTIPKLQVPAAASSRTLTFLPGICMAAARTVWLSFHLGCHRSAVPLSALNVSPLTQTIAPLGIGPLFQLPNLWMVSPVLLTLQFFPLVLHPTKFCMVLYILFNWSGPPVHSQLLFCMHFCVWRCIPDVSMERDVLHVHLFSHHLVLPNCLDFYWNIHKHVVLATWFSAFRCIYFLPDLFIDKDLLLS